MYLRGRGHHSPEIVADNVAWHDGGSVDAALVTAVVAFLPSGPTVV